MIIEGVLRQMKLLFYINAIHQGGAERVIVNLANQFAEKGDEVTLVTSFEDYWEYPVSDKVTRYSFEQRDFEKEGFLRQNIKWTLKLRNTIKKYNPEVVISFMAEPNFRTILASAGLRVKTIISVRNDPDKEYPNFVYRMLAKILYLFSDGIVFQTEDAKKWFSSSIQRKSRIIYNQVDRKFYGCLNDGESKAIITCGRLVEQKNQTMLIEAFSRIADIVEENLYIYGEGELRAKLEKQIKDKKLEDRVFLPGDIKNVETILSKAALFVLPSDYEGMPNALMEAMAVGVPCISTDCPCGGPMMLFHNDAEFLVPVGNVEEMAEKMKNLLLDREKREENGKKMKAYSQYFTPERIFRNWIEYVDEII